MMEIGGKRIFLRFFCRSNQVAAPDRRKSPVFIICKPEGDPLGTGFRLKDMIQVPDRALVPIDLAITLPVSQQTEVILKIAGGPYSPCIRLDLIDPLAGSLRMSQKMKEPLDIAIEDLAFYSVVTQGSIEFSDPPWRFARLCDGWMNQEHAWWVLRYIRSERGYPLQPDRHG
jgi:hypothetical protein